MRGEDQKTYCVNDHWEHHHMREEDFQKSPKTLKLLTSNQTTVKKFPFLIHISKNIVPNLTWNNDLITQFL